METSSYNSKHSAAGQAATLTIQTTLLVEEADHLEQSTKKIKVSNDTTNKGTILTMPSYKQTSRLKKSV